MNKNSQRPANSTFQQIYRPFEINPLYDAINIFFYFVIGVSPILPDNVGDTSINKQTMNTIIKDSNIDIEDVENYVDSIVKYIQQTKKGKKVKKREVFAGQTE